MPCLCAAMEQVTIKVAIVMTRSTISTSGTTHTYTGGESDTPIKNKESASLLCVTTL